MELDGAPGHGQGIAMPAVSTRFAPSPTGWMHLGHAYAAWFSWDRARESGGRFLLRMEDIDAGRVRPGFGQAILDDLRWLGLAWDGEVVWQSARQAAYAEALARLDALGVVYPCFCTRRAIADEIARMGGAPHDGEESTYPGTCRVLAPDLRAERLARGDAHALRLDLAAALRLTGPLAWTDRRFGRQRVDAGRAGDVVLARKDAGTSYHLAVTVDDAWQGIGLVTRGEDLLDSTHIHRLLQALLGLPVPEWEHHRLVRDTQGRRLAKRDDATALRTLRAAGWDAERVLGEARRRAQ